MRTPWYVDPPHDLITQRFLFVFEANNPDVRKFVRNYAWEFWILQKVMNRQPVLLNSAKAKMADISKEFPPQAKPSEPATLTIQPFADQFSFNCQQYCKYLPPLVEFQMVLTGKPVQLKNDLNFYAIIDGSMDFPVQ